MYATTKGVLAGFLDFSFPDLVTKRLIKFFYVSGIAVDAIFLLSAIVTGFSHGAGTGFASLIFSPVIAIVFIGIVRMQLEIVMLLFRISDYARTIAEAYGSDLAQN